MAEPDTQGCAGTCCAAFHIRHTPTSLRRAVATGRVVDGQQILDMLIPLTPKEARERNVEHGGPGTGFPWSARGHHFTCRHWDEGTGLCGIYEDRPGMCRDYPYGKPCPLNADCRCTNGQPQGESAVPAAG